jgi:hypothetical protein
VRGETGSGHVVTLVFDRFEGPLAKSARIMAEKILKALPTAGYSISVLDLGDACACFRATRRIGRRLSRPSHLLPTATSRG